ncbi:transposase [Haliea sp. AH-315-K21]|uniref:Transposase n=1 Tax=SAR86 cluster bacterium TaxID=2030880 RepID=A0A2A5CCV5_9GAMM|nr:transposase [Haliea sp. AH-315-K21]PCJ41206.1 MAG: transposase [SAR86 cluster bacterium]
MPRKPRIFIPNQPLHLVVRGHSRQPIVARKCDYQTFVDYLRKASNKYSLQIHAWVLMTNHLHLLVTPNNAESLPRTMQWLGRNYARYFNLCYKRSGSIWEGRYKTSFIDTERYLLTCHCYIEMNPVRANMVELPEQYPWSSHRHNAFGKNDYLTTTHPILLAMSKNPEERINHYRNLFKEELSRKTLTQFRRGASKGKAVGNPEFILNIAKMERDRKETGVRVKLESYLQCN